MWHRPGDSAVGAVLIAVIAAAGTFTVTTPADAGPGSLRQAIADANAANGGTINVTTTGLLVLNSPLPVLATPITLNANNLLVSGGDGGAEPKTFAIPRPRSYPDLPGR